MLCLTLPDESDPNSGEWRTLMGTHVVHVLHSPGMDARTGPLESTDEHLAKRGAKNVKTSD